MTLFKHSPRHSPRKQSAQDWVRQAHTHTSINTDTAAAGDTISVSEWPPWHGMKRRAAAKNMFNLRLTDRHFAMLQLLGEHDEERSRQKILKEILLPELEKRAEEAAERLASGTSKLERQGQLHFGE